jgi:hypothetical protein
MKPNAFHYFVGLPILLGVSLIAAACGIKGPPVPPRSEPPPVVKDLSYDILDDSLALQWTVPAMTVTNDAPFAGCIVHRAVRTPEDAQCRTCPLPFRKVADQPVPLISKKGRETKMGYSEQLSTGFNYVFKVKCYTEDGRESADSNLVEFDY